MKTSYATSVDCDRLEGAVDRLRALAGKVCEARTELVLAGVGTFATQKEHWFLMRLETRLSKMHRKLASRVRRARR